MRNLMLAGALIAGVSLPLSALEVYNQDDKKVDVYGKIIAYTGGGGSFPGGTYTKGTDDRGTFLLGFQSNSRLGVKATLGKLTGHIELGAQEDGILRNSSLSNAGSASFTNGAPGFRLFYMEYDFDDAGKFLIGKTHNLTAVAGFIGDIMNTDNGGQGFGGLITGGRRLQIRYSIAGFTIGLTEQVAGTLSAYSNGVIPRVSAVYEMNSGGVRLKVGGTYTKRYATSGAPRDTIHGAGAGHVFAAVKGNVAESTYLSGVVHWGVNGHYYGEQTTFYNRGRFANDTLIGSSTSNPIRTATGNITRAGLYLELGNSFTSDLMLRVAVGYQATMSSDEADLGDKIANTYMAMINLPYKVSNYFTVTPQIGYYGASYKQGTGTAATSHTRAGLVGVIQFAASF